MIACSDPREHNWPLSDGVVMFDWFRVPEWRVSELDRKTTNRCLGTDGISAQSFPSSNHTMYKVRDSCQRLMIYLHGHWQRHGPILAVRPDSVLVYLVFRWSPFDSIEHS